MLWILNIETTPWWKKGQPQLSTKNLPFPKQWKEILRLHTREHQLQWDELCKCSLEIYNMAVSPNPQHCLALHTAHCKQVASKFTVQEEKIQETRRIRKTQSYIYYPLCNWFGIKHPTHVTKPESSCGTVWISFRVTELVMVSMGTNPVNWTPLYSSIINTLHFLCLFDWIVKFPRGVLFFYQERNFTWRARTPQ